MTQMLSRYLTSAILCVTALSSGAIADDTLYRFEGNTLPYDESAGWVIFDECIPPCSESVENGHFVLRWSVPNDSANYHLRIAEPGDPPPPTLWVEWRFRSNHPLGQNFFTCDGKFVVQYKHVRDIVSMYGDAAIQISGANFVLGLDNNVFHILRFESLDGNNYRISVDGQVFVVAARFQDNSGVNFLQMLGEGGCDGFPNTVNAWDFVRYGTIAFGEQVIATDPPAGTLITPGSTGIDRFTVTFDSANYVYIDDIVVSVTGGLIPAVTKTRRLDNSEPDILEIVLDRGLTVGETTTFTFTDGVTTNVVAYTLVPDPDDDGDGVSNTQDNCPRHANPNQADCDNDGTGDVCTIAECTGDPACADCDLNGIPDACDPDDDADGTINACEACPQDPEKLSPGVCGCGTPDTDTDQDTIPDCNDQCPGEDDRIDRNANSVPDCLEELPIPTLSTWGMVALALSLLIIARSRFGAIGSSIQPKR